MNFRKEKFHKCKIVFSYFIILLLFLTISISKAVSIEKKVTLTLASGWSRHDLGNFWLDKFIDRINKEGKTVKIDYKGGPEVVPVFEGLTYVSKGTIDLWHGTPPYYTGHIPVALGALYFSASQEEMRKFGFWDLFDKVHREKAGVTALGQLWRGDPFGCFLKKPIEKADLKGLKIRTTPIMNPFVEALGGIPMSIPPAETYTALERGIVDGLMYPYGPGLIEQRWHEVVQYVIHPVIPWETCAPLLANVKRWDSLPKEVKDEILKVILELEPQVYVWYKNEAVKRIDWAINQGFLKVIKLSPPEAEKWVTVAKEASWNFVLKRDEFYGPKFRDLARKIEEMRKK